MRNISLLFLVLLICTSTIIAQEKKDKKAIKKEQSIKNYEALKTLLNSKNYEFVGEWATTQSGRRISLFSNTNYLRINAENAAIFLPFFGTSQNAGYGTGGSIEINNEITDYRVNFNDKKQKANIKFTAKNNNLEVFYFSIEIFGGGNTSISVNSSYRSHIRYSGKTTAYKKNEN